MICILTSLFTDKTVKSWFLKDNSVIVSKILHRDVDKFISGAFDKFSKNFDSYIIINSERRVLVRFAADENGCFRDITDDINFIMKTDTLDFNSIKTIHFGVDNRIILIESNNLHELCYNQDLILDRYISTSFTSSINLYCYGVNIFIRLEDGRFYRKASGGEFMELSNVFGWSEMNHDAGPRVSSEDGVNPISSISNILSIERVYRGYGFMLFLLSNGYVYYNRTDSLDFIRIHIRNSHISPFMNNLSMNKTIDDTKIARVSLTNREIYLIEESGRCWCTEYSLQDSQFIYSKPYLVFQGYRIEDIITTGISCALVVYNQDQCGIVQGPRDIICYCPELSGRKIIHFIKNPFFDKLHQQIFVTISGGLIYQLDVYTKTVIQLNHQRNDFESFANVLC